jgi:hypothetical protein
VVVQLQGREGERSRWAASWPLARFRFAFPGSPFAADRLTLLPLAFPDIGALS